MNQICSILFQMIPNRLQINSSLWAKGFYLYFCLVIVSHWAIIPRCVGLPSTTLGMWQVWYQNNKIYYTQHVISVVFTWIRWPDDGVSLLANLGKIFEIFLRNFGFLGGDSDRYLEYSSIFFEVLIFRSWRDRISGKLICIWWAACMSFPEIGLAHSWKFANED